VQSRIRDSFNCEYLNHQIPVAGDGGWILEEGESLLAQAAAQEGFCFKRPEFPSPLGARPLKAPTAQLAFLLRLFKLAVQKCTVGMIKKGLRAVATTGQPAGQYQNDSE
jgi:hypothetical protein